jgi:hypothetical protein
MNIFKICMPGYVPMQVKFYVADFAQEVTFDLNNGLSDRNRHF